MALTQVLAIYIFYHFLCLPCDVRFSKHLPRLVLTALWLALRLFRGLGTSIVPPMREAEPSYIYINTAEIILSII